MRLLALVCLLLWPLGAAATQDRWPALFDVTGVKQGDRLNIRSEPDAGAEIIGSLAPGATGVEIVEPNARQTWGRVNVDGRSGWVSLAYMRRQPGQWLGALPEISRCFGTEPFWSLAIGPDGAWTLDRPGEPSIDGQRGFYIGSDNRRDRYAFGGALRTPDGDAQTVTGTLRLAECSDGMSDRRYGISLDMLRNPDGGQTLYSGCCTLTPN